jgi:DNA-binding winged helix-turn-helix (wHTH) protein
MPDSDASELLLREIRQLLATTIDLHERALKNLRDIESKMAVKSLEAQPCSEDLDEARPQQKVMIANGHRLSAEDVMRMDEDQFDIVLDTTARVLRVRQDPVEHTPLQEAHLWHIGGYRMKLLAYMLEHPARLVSPENPPSCYGGSNEEPTEGALVKTISLLRQTLGTPGRENPYILTQPAWGHSRRANACVYGMNPKWKYLVIK